jgi:hypothetical protein
MTTIKLSPAEADLWNWARSAAEEFWKDDFARDDGKHFDQCPVGIAVNGTATIANDPDVIDDILFRLGEQLPAMARGEGGTNRDGSADAQRMKALGDIATANRIIRKLQSLTR